MTHPPFGEFNKARPGYGRVLLRGENSPARTCGLRICNGESMAAPPLFCAEIIHRIVSTGAILISIPEGVRSFRGYGYFISSARTRMATAATNRQSTATVMAMRNQDDFASIVLTSLASDGPQVVPAACGPMVHSSGPILRRRSHARKRGAPIQSLKCSAPVPISF